MKLIYQPKAGFTGPPFPWPARDHYEPDDDTARRKLASGFYHSESGRETKTRDKERAQAKAAANTKATEIADAAAAGAEEVATDARDVADDLKERADAQRTTLKGRGD